MERQMEEKMDSIMGKPGVVGAICVDKKGLTISARSRSQTPLLDETSSSSDEAEIIGSPKKTPRKGPDEILSVSVRSASFNIVFQVLTRIFTFLLNAFILRYVSHEVLGICNVRLALLYSSVMFLSREPFRRAVLRKSEKDSWPETINLVWLVVPNTIFWSLLLGIIWSYVLSQPDSAPYQTSQYRISVVTVCFALIVDSLTEVPYIIGQYFMFYRLRIIGDTVLIAVRSFCLCMAVVKYPSSAIFSYGFGTLFGCSCVLALYCGYFYYYINYVSSAKRDLPFSSVKSFFPRPNLRVPAELSTLVWTFYKQGILKQLLTEGERYIMTFLDVLTFEEQGIYDLVSNLGSLAARFVFLPIEESAYSFFAQSLTKQAKTESRKMREMMKEIGSVLGRLVRMMLMVGMVILVYGLAYSNTVLFIYGGERLSDKGPGTKLLQANCFNIFTLALNGVTEAFTFAAMDKDQMDKFNKRLVWFSGIYLAAAWAFTWYLGSVGFFVANTINMLLRIVQSGTLVRLKFAEYKLNPFQWWLPEIKVMAAFGISSVIILLLTMLNLGRVLFVLLGLIVFGCNVVAALYYDRDLTTFFLNIYKTKSA